MPSIPGRLLSLEVVVICPIIWMPTHLPSHFNAGPKSWGDIPLTVEYLYGTSAPGLACDLSSQF